MESILSVLLAQQHWAERWIPGSVGLLLTGTPIVLIVRQILLGYACHKWPTVPGVITSSERIVRVTSPRVRMVYARVSYRYEVNGETRLGQNLRYGHAIEANASTADRILAEYPVGREVNIRVKGQESVLLPGPSGWLFVYLPLLAFVFGAIVYALVTGT